MSYTSIKQIKNLNTRDIFDILNNIEDSDIDTLISTHINPVIETVYKHNKYSKFKYEFHEIEYFFHDNFVKAIKEIIKTCVDKYICDLYEASEYFYSYEYIYNSFLL